MSNVTNKIVFEVDGRKIKSSTSDFKDLEKVLEKTKGSFSGMEKIMTLQLAQSIRLAGSFKTMTGFTAQMAPPLLNVGGILRKVNDLSKFNVKTQKGALRVNTMITNELKGLQPEIEKMVQLQDKYNASLLKTNDSRKKENKIVALGLTKQELFSAGGTGKLLARARTSILAGAEPKLTGKMGDIGKVSGLAQLKSASNLLIKSYKDLPANLKKVDLSFGSIVKVAKTASLAAGALFLGLVAFGSASPLLQAQMAFMSFQFEQMGIIVGDSLVPIFEGLTIVLQIVLDFWTSLSPEMQAAIKTTILVIATIALLTVGITLLNLAMSPITLILAAIVLAIFAFSLAFETNFLGTREIVMDFVNSFLDGFDLIMAFFDGGSLLDAITGLFKMAIVLISGFPLTIGRIMANAFDEIGKFFTRFGGFLGGFGEFISGVAKGIGEIFAGIGTLDIDRIIKGAKMVGTAVLGGFGVQFFAEGGIVAGSGAQAAVVHGGEMILNRGHQQELFNFLSGRGGTSIVNNANRSNTNNITLNIDVSGTDSFGLGSISGNQIVRALRKQGGLFT